MLRDVICNYVALADAETEYGVVLTGIGADLAVDLPATEALRAQRRRNEAGTRVLLAPPAPVAVAGAGDITLAVTRTVTHRDGTTTATVVTGSRFAIDEPRSVRMEAGA